MLLTRDEIKNELASGRLVIDPPPIDRDISVVSVDLHLGNIFRVFIRSTQPIEVHENTDYHDYTTEVIANTIDVQPQETILGITQESITLPNNLAGWLEGRSRFARLGLLIHISAGLVQPGVSNKQVLEITNLSPNVMRLTAGESICQVVFQECVGKAVYQGKFQSQQKP